jgi:hypothetical protein
MAKRLLIGGALTYFVNYRIAIDGPLRPEHFDLLSEIILRNCLGTPVWVKPIGGIGSGCSDPE